MKVLVVAGATEGQVMAQRVVSLLCNNTSAIGA